MKTNILFIVADDLNAWIGALGRHPNVRTPNIDALADRGTLFSHAYCAAPYCNASRMSVFTGYLPSTTGIYSNEPFWESMPRKETFVERLRESGYYTFGAGKVFHGVFDYKKAGEQKTNYAEWRPLQHRDFLWDDFRSNSTDALPDDRPSNGLFDFGAFDKVPPMYHLFDWGPLPEQRAAEMADARVSQSVCRFLDSHPKEPFFCAAGFYKPHLPWHVPQRFFDLYDTESLTLPIVREDDLDDVPKIAKGWALSPPDHDLVTKSGQWRHAVHGYLAAISYCDYVIGQVVAALDRSGLSDRTAIVFWGDNGFHLGEKLHWRKFVLWEEATRVPLIVVPPGAKDMRGRVYDPVSLIDIFPTLLDLCGVAHEKQGDGESLWPLIDGTARRDAPVVTTWHRGNHSIRMKHWRFTRYRDGTEELYDHLTDPNEWNNLAGLPQLQALREQLAQWLPKDQ